MRKPLTLFLAATLAALSATLAAPAQASDDLPVYTDRFSNLAVGGFDSVSFFIGEPVRGSRDFETSWNGANWRFASAENLAKFEADPTAFAPQYGGYCAWAVAQGYLAKGDPRFARIVDGKLYLNFNAKVQRDWSQDIPGFIARADANWPGILKD